MRNVFLGLVAGLLVYEVVALRNECDDDTISEIMWAATARRPMPLAAFDGRRLRFTRAFGPKETMFTEIDGAGTTAADYDFRIENRESRAGVRITSDRPLERLVFWSHPRTVCPEPYIDVSVEPGAERSWYIHYELYEPE